MLLTKLTCDGETLYSLAVKLYSSCIFLMCSHINEMKMSALVVSRNYLKKSMQCMRVSS